MAEEVNMMSLRQSAEFDRVNGLKDKLTGWGIVSKLRANENSKSQKRKHNLAKVKHHVSN